MNLLDSTFSTDGFFVHIENKLLARACRSLPEPVACVIFVCLIPISCEMKIISDTDASVLSSNACSLCSGTACIRQCLGAKLAMKKFQYAGTEAVIEVHNGCLDSI